MRVTNVTIVTFVTVVHQIETIAGLSRIGRTAVAPIYSFSIRQEHHMAGKGGRNPGAGRPPGTAWRPTVRALRVETVMQMQRVVEADRNPLTVLVDWVLDSSAHWCIGPICLFATRRGSPPLARYTADLRQCGLGYFCLPWHAD
jgi:hypothetical protein